MNQIAIVVGVKARDQKELASDLVSLLLDHGLTVLCLDHIKEWLEIEEVVGKEKEDDLLESTDLVITIGGDGTILYAARMIGEKGIPVCGMNMGRLGFLNELQCQNGDWKSELLEIISGQYWIEERLVIGGKLTRQGKVKEEWIAVNDVVLSRIGFPHLITVDVALNKEPVISYPCDGIVVATPTGSTGYSFSAGGPIISAEMEALVITPICAHDFYARPWVVDGGTEIELASDARSKDYGVTVDGEIFIHCEPEDRISIKKEEWKIKFLRLRDSSHHRNLRTRFQRRNQL